MPDPILWCIPNLSEGRRTSLLEELAEQLQQVPGLCLADHSWDGDHHRSVFTLLGPATALGEGLFRLFDWAARHIDLNQHDGSHPRVGAVDVVPFVPVLDSSLQFAVEISLKLAEEVARRFEVPIFLYEKSSSNGRLLPDLRRGGLAGLASRLAQEPPDFGPPTLHPQLGASVFGARNPLIAYNIVLATDQLEVAKKIALRVREGNGGLVSVRAIPIRLEEQGRVQVSLNLTDPLRTGFGPVFEMVKREAQRYGVLVHSSELIGVCPLEALVEVARYYLQLDGLSAEQVLENQLLHFTRGTE